MAPFRWILGLLVLLWTAPASAGPPQPIGNPEMWVMTADYPKEALAARQGGEVGVAIAVDATGKVDGCQVVKSSGVAALDQKTCELIVARARYKPATNDRGDPFRSSDEKKVRWVMPDLDRQPFAPEQAVITVELGTGGKIASCKASAEGASLDFSASEACSSLDEPDVAFFILALRPNDRRTRVLLVTSIMNGAAIARPAVLRDAEQLYSIRADFDVSQTGKMINCEPGPANGQGSLPINLCNMATDDLDFVTTDDPAPRHGSFEWSLFALKP